MVEFVAPAGALDLVANPATMIDTTLTEYLNLINEAGESKVDVLVFPEGTLNYVGINNRQKLIKHAVELDNDFIMDSTNFENSCSYSKASEVDK